MKKTFLIVAVLVSFTAFAFAGGDKNQDALQATQLTEDQQDIIYGIYEEEKVARDVYITLGDLYPDETTFANIQLSEQTHMDAVRKLCVKYGITDIPDVDQPVGDFSLGIMESLYNGFVDDGDDGLLSNALQVGIDIEKMDIEDLGNVLLDPNMPRDVQKVLANLIEGSIRHLDAFTNALER